MGKDTKRYKKIRKDRNRCRKMGIDGGPIEEYGVSCDVANAHVWSLTAVFPT